MNDLEDIIVRIQTLFPFPAGVREDGFANIREADIAVKQSFASGGQLSRSLLSPWSLLVGVPKARESYQRCSSALHSSVVLAVVLITFRLNFCSNSHYVDSFSNIRSVSVFCSV